jgi:glucosamine 6-phosphate synthetase-like amidotransferase/phosphosugar isomerase protein
VLAAFSWFSLLLLFMALGRGMESGLTVHPEKEIIREIREIREIRGTLLNRSEPRIARIARMKKRNDLLKLSRIINMSITGPS